MRPKYIHKQKRVIQPTENPLAEALNLHQVLQALVLRRECVIQLQCVPFAHPALAARPRVVYVSPVLRADLIGKDSRGLRECNGAFAGMNTVKDIAYFSVVKPLDVLVADELFFFDD